MAKKAKSTKAWAKFPKYLSTNYYSDIRPVIAKLRKDYEKRVESEITELLEFKYVSNDNISFDDSASERVSRLFRELRIEYFGQEYPLGAEPLTALFINKLRKQVKKSGQSMSGIQKKRFESNVEFMSGQGIVRNEPWLDGYITDWTNANVSLIKNIPLQTITEIEQQVMTSIMRGDSSKYLKDQIQLKLGVSETRARLIARDQSNKLYGTITELRSKFNGWDFYEWDDSNDSKVRSLSNSSGYSDHKSLDGKIFKFSEPPITVFKGKRSGERNNPGQDINCRCVSLILFDREKISNLKKQSDGSYEVKQQLAA